MPGDGASGGQAVCRPRGVEHLQDVPRVLMHSNLGAKTSRGLCLYFANSEFSAKAFVYQSHGKYTTVPADHILQPVA